MPDDVRTLARLPGLFSICRFDPGAAVPAWALTTASPFTSVTRTRDELTVICPDDVCGEAPRRDRGWHCLRIVGSTDLEVPGILASVVGPLADAGLSVFAVATYDTDHVLVNRPAEAEKALVAAGHRIIDDD